MSIPGLFAGRYVLVSKEDSEIPWKTGYVQPYLTHSYEVFDWPPFKPGEPLDPSSVSPVAATLTREAAEAAIRLLEL